MKTKYSPIIIEHRGSTSLLSKAVEEGGKTYPFLFTAIEPDMRRWPYKLVPMLDPEYLTETQLIELFKSRRVLRADWEQQVDHPLGLITIYLPPSGGTSDVRKARFEHGPEMELNGPNVPRSRRASTWTCRSDRERQRRTHGRARACGFYLAAGSHRRKPECTRKTDTVMYGPKYIRTH
jgi:hypothetical protein